MDEWNSARIKHQPWPPRYDKTIERQALAYIQWLKDGQQEMVFEPQHSEDYCFARAFGLITPEKGEKLWPNLHGHESDRLIEMEKQLQNYVITSRDHRVIQAIWMKKTGIVLIQNSHAVNKSWPQFWRFVEYAQKNYKDIQTPKNTTTE